MGNGKNIKWEVKKKCHFSPQSLALARSSGLTIINVEEYSLFMAPQSASKTWRGRCMWAFEGGGGPALRYGEGGVDLISERSSSRRYYRKMTVHSHSRQHSIGYPIPTLHSPDPSNWPSLKVTLHSISPIFFMFSFLLLFFSLSHAFFWFSSPFIFRQRDICKGFWSAFK
jgi:hypothetical protein